MPFYEYKCTQCGDTKTRYLTWDDVHRDGVTDRLLMPCECEPDHEDDKMKWLTTWHTRVWKSPAIGAVQGAGRSPARPAQR